MYIFTEKVGLWPTIARVIWYLLDAFQVVLGVIRKLYSISTHLGFPLLQTILCTWETVPLSLDCCLLDLFEYLPVMAVLRFCYSRCWSPHQRHLISHRGDIIRKANFAADKKILTPVAALLAISGKRLSSSFHMWNIPPVGTNAQFIAAMYKSIVHVVHFFARTPLCFLRVLITFDPNVSDSVLESENSFIQVSIHPTGHGSCMTWSWTNKCAKVFCGFR